MKNLDDLKVKRTLPTEIEDLYRLKVITTEEVEPMLKLRNDLMKAAPQPREGFQNRLAQRLQMEFEPQKDSTHRMRPPKHLTVRIAVTIIAVLTIGVGTVFAVNAILRQFIHYDAGLNAAFTSESGVELNQSQTVGNYTLNLQWANADSNRLTIGFTVSGFACTADYVNCDIQVKMFDQNRHEIPMLDGRADTSQPAYTYLYNFDLTSLVSSDSIRAFQIQITPYGMTNEGADPNQPGLIRGHAVTLGKTIALNFSVPMNGKARIFNTAESATDKNTTITLRRVVVSPSQTRVAICFVPPTSDRSWTAIPRLTTNGTEVVGGGAVNFVSGIGEAAGEVCNEYSYNAAMFDYKGRWQLEVAELVGFGSSGNDQQRIAGHWIFRFQVP